MHKLSIRDAPEAAAPAVPIPLDSFDDANTTPPWIVTLCTCDVPESAHPQPIPDPLWLETLSIPFQIVSSSTTEFPAPAPIPAPAPPAATKVPSRIVRFRTDESPKLPIPVSPATSYVPFTKSRPPHDPDAAPIAGDPRAVSEPEPDAVNVRVADAPHPTPAELVDVSEFAPVAMIVTSPPSAKKGVSPTIVTEERLIVIVASAMEIELFVVDPTTVIPRDPEGKASPAQVIVVASTIRSPFARSQTGNIRPAEPARYGRPCLKIQ
jgi:hypothetical protein